MILILTPLQNTLDSLQIAINEYNKDTKNTFVRDSFVQRFEYCYELSWKMLKRYLKLSSSSTSEIEEMNFESLIRLGSSKGLLKHGWDTWKTYRDARNTTSHAYDEKKR